MPVYKRDPRLDAQYYVSGNTVRRAAPSREDEPETRRASNRDEYFRREERTQRAGQRTQRREEPRTQRRQEPLRDTRTRQEQRRAQPARAYYAAQPEFQRMTREEINQRTVQQHHAWQQAAAERRMREEKEKREAEELAEAQRRRQQRVNTLFAAIAILTVVCIAGGIYSVLSRYIRIDAMTVQQRQLQSQIDDQQRRLEELQVEINKQSNIAQVQDYARDNLNMDYVDRDNVRTVQLPDVE